MRHVELSLHDEEVTSVWHTQWNRLGYFHMFISTYRSIEYADMVFFGCLTIELFNVCVNRLCI